MLCLWLNLATSLKLLQDKKMMILLLHLAHRQILLLAHLQIWELRLIQLHRLLQTCHKVQLTQALHQTWELSPQQTLLKLLAKKLLKMDKSVMKNYSKSTDQWILNAGQDGQDQMGAAPAAPAAPAPAAPAPDMQMGKSEQDSLAKQETEDLKKSLEIALKTIEMMARPSRKAVTEEIQILGKTESDVKSGSPKKDFSGLSKGELTSMLNSKVKEPTLSKSDREAINSFILNNQNKEKVLDILGRN
jgi:ribosomal protein L12E/L44/L45/RPP1/RPP2